MANPENDSPQEITHKIKRSQPNLRILVPIIMRKRWSIQQGEKDNCWSEQSPEKLTISTVPGFFLATRYRNHILQTGRNATGSNSYHCWLISSGAFPGRLASALLLPTTCCSCCLLRSSSLGGAWLWLNASCCWSSSRPLHGNAPLAARIAVQVVLLIFVVVVIIIVIITALARGKVTVIFVCSYWSWLGKKNYNRVWSIKG